MYICICQNITDHDIKEAVQQGQVSLRALNEHLGIASCCGQCRCAAKQVLQEALLEIKDEQSKG